MWTYSLNFKQYKTPAGSILQNLSGQTAWQHLSGPFFFCWEEKAPSYNWVYFLNPSYHPFSPSTPTPNRKSALSTTDSCLLLSIYSTAHQPTHPARVTRNLESFPFCLQKSPALELHFQLQDYRKDSHWWSCYSSSMFAKWKILWTTELMAAAGVRFCWKWGK